MRRRVKPEPNQRPEEKTNGMPGHLWWGSLDDSVDHEKDRTIEDVFVPCGRSTFQATYSRRAPMLIAQYNATHNDPVALLVALLFIGGCFCFAFVFGRGLVAMSQPRQAPPREPQVTGFGAASQPSPSNVAGFRGVEFTVVNIKDDPGFQDFKKSKETVSVEEAVFGDD